MQQEPTARQVLPPPVQADPEQEVSQWVREQRAQRSARRRASGPQALHWEQDAGQAHEAPKEDVARREQQA